MPITTLPHKKDIPFVYMFTTVCLNDFQDYKKGIVYEFFRERHGQKPYKIYKKAYADNEYQEVEFEEAIFTFANPNTDGEHIDPTCEFFQWNVVSSRESRFHFKLLGKQGMYSCKVPQIKKLLGLKLKIPKRYIPIVDKQLVGSEEAAHLNRELRSKVLGPFALLESENKKVIEQFNETIHYALSSLISFCKIANVVDLETEIDKVNTLLLQYYSFALSAEETYIQQKRDEMKEYLDNHHSLMDSLNDGIKKLTNGGKIK
ncbi:hypothetical protein [Bacillus sp. FSL H8-0515]|uniref:hypothetical protein n=1 Tax=Bacillus sp. FSL H8-0515 TaxID=2921396 RepID=UPI0030F8782D